jgi:hypothetical protein
VVGQCVIVVVVVVLWRRQLQWIVKWEVPVVEETRLPPKILLVLALGAPGVGVAGEGGSARRSSDIYHHLRQMTPWLFYVPSVQENRPNCATSPPCPGPNSIRAATRPTSYNTSRTPRIAKVETDAHFPMRQLAQSLPRCRRARVLYRRSR